MVTAVASLELLDAMEYPTYAAFRHQLGASMHESRREYLTHHRSARAWAALDRATNDQMHVTYDPCVIERDSLNGKHVVVIGSGVGGLTTAYELLANNSGVKVTVLEARDRTGGRCLTLRTGHTLTEDKNSDLYSSPGDAQVVRFEQIGRASCR